MVSDASRTAELPALAAEADADDADDADDAAADADADADADAARDALDALEDVLVACEATLEDTLEDCEVAEALDDCAVVQLVRVMMHTMMAMTTTAMNTKCFKKVPSQRGFSCKFQTRLCQTVY